METRQKIRIIADRIEVLRKDYAIIFGHIIHSSIILARQFVVEILFRVFQFTLTIVIPMVVFFIYVDRYSSILDAKGYNFFYIVSFLKLIIYAAVFLLASAVFVLEFGSGRRHGHSGSHEIDVGIDGKKGLDDEIVRSVAEELEIGTSSTINDGSGSGGVIADTKPVKVQKPHNEGYIKVFIKYVEKLRVFLSFSDDRIYFYVPATISIIFSVTNYILYESVEHTFFVKANYYILGSIIYIPVGIIWALVWLTDRLFEFVKETLAFFSG